MRTRLVVALSALAVAALLVLPGPAFAAAPETPKTVKPELETITAEGATLRGLLNPGAPGEAGATYQFLYRASATECEGGGASPEPEEASAGAEGEEVRQPVEGLTPQTRYSVCLKAKSTGGEVSVGPTVHFLTGPPETPSGEEATDITSSSATLKGILNPNSPGEPGKYRFRYAPSESDCEAEGQKTLPAPAEAPASSLGNQAEVVERTATGLLPTTSYTFCLFARNEAGEGVLGAPVTFTTPASSPVVGAESAFGINSSSATVAATISPGALATAYHVELVTAAQFAATEWGSATKIPTTEIELPAALTALPVQQELTGLQPSTLYHYRFVASNSLGEVPGPDATFATSIFGAPTSALPDDRAWELVSGLGYPGDASIPSSGFIYSNGDSNLKVDYPFRAAADGNGLAWVGSPADSGGNGFSGGGVGNNFTSRRDGASGWIAEAVTPQTAAPSEQASPAPNESFSEDLSVGIFDTGVVPGFAVKTHPAGPSECPGIYARSASGFEPLFTSSKIPGDCGVNRAQAESYGPQRLIFAGFSAENTEYLLQTPAPLSPGDQPSAEGEGNNLYVSREGTPTAVNILPGGAPEPEAVFGSTSGEDRPPGFPPTGGIIAAKVPGDFSNVASADGSRVFWTALESIEELGRPTAMRLKALYARDNPLSPSAETVQLDASEAPPGPGATEVADREGRSGGGRFWTASNDGTKVFFTDCSRLTEDSTAVAAGGCSHTTEAGAERRILQTGNDLYEYDFDKPVGKRLTDLTIDRNGDPLGADVQGVIGASEQGAYVYFVASGALASGAEERTCRRAKVEAKELQTLGTLTPALQVRLNGEQAAEEAGRLPAGRGCNLYVIHSGEPPQFIAALSAQDDELERRGGPSEGGWLGDWRPSLGNRTAEVTPHGQHLVLESTQQLTGYDNSVLGVMERQRALEVFVYSAADSGLICASCSPTGAAPAAEPVGGGTYLPVSVNPTYQPRWISGDGSRVFFDSSQPLAPQDTNGVQDVYQWEREGSPGCPAPNSVSGGCTSLLSAGSDSTFSYFLDADASGDNVFFTHHGPLGGALVAPGQNVIYDARANGGFPEASVSCSGGSCPVSSTGAAPFTAPASPSFYGPGNQKPAKEKKHKKHHKHKGTHNRAKKKSRHHAGTNKGGK